MAPKKNPQASSDFAEESPAPSPVTMENLRDVLNELRRSSPVIAPIGGSFSRCTSRFSGDRDAVKVNDFIHTISVYKSVEHISDEDALIGLPLLLEKFAATWWQGVQSEVHTHNIIME